MKRILLASLVAGLVAVGAPSAMASDATFTGGCGFDSTTDPSGQVANPDVFTGAVFSRTLVYSTGTPSENPVSADVTCTIRVNGVAQASATATFSGTVAVAGAAPIQFLAPEGSLVELCTTVNYTGGNTSATVTTCGAAIEITIPPDEVNQLIADNVDPAVCPVLAGLSPGVPGVVDIDSEGDVDVAGAPFWDCPPYGA